MKRRPLRMNGVALAAEIASWPELEIDELREQWETMFGTTPSREIGRSFLTRAMAYRLQERVFGGLKPSTRRLLTRVAEETATARSSPPIRKAQTGTILVREWRGTPHRVTMLDDGVSFTACVTSRFQKSPGRSPAVAGRDRGFLDCAGERRRRMMLPDKTPLRSCAIYTRKSSEEGLEQEFNSLQAQREACEAFIKSQAGEGWRLVNTGYDDGGMSGGTMERPALQRLLTEINERRIDVVVV
jgi:hypothetical protein